MFDVLYRLTEADIPGIPRWAPDRSVNSDAAVSVTTTWSNNQQLPYLLNVAAMLLVGGAAQYPTKWYFSVDRNDGNVLGYLAGGELVSVVAAQNNVVATPWLEYVVPPGHRVIGNAIFNAGAAANTIQMHVQGWFIPRGTLALR